MAREKPKSERIGAEEKDLDWPFGRKPDRLLTLVQTDRFLKKIFLS